MMSGIFFILSQASILRYMPSPLIVIHQHMLLHFAHGSIPRTPLLTTFRVILYWHWTPLSTEKSFISISSWSLCRLIWRHWTLKKMLVRYRLSGVCLWLSHFSQLSFIQYVGLCVLSLPNFPVMIARMFILYHHHHQLGSMNDWPLFRARSWNNGTAYHGLLILYVVLHKALMKSFR